MPLFCPPRHALCVSEGDCSIGPASVGLDAGIPRDDWSDERLNPFSSESDCEAHAADGALPSFRLPQFFKVQYICVCVFIKSLCGSKAASKMPIMGGIINNVY